jgi:hypothetical protein
MDPDIQMRAADMAHEFGYTAHLNRALRAAAHLTPELVDALYKKGGAASYLEAAISNPSFPAEKLPQLAKAKSGVGLPNAHKLREAVAAHAAAPEDLVRELAQDRRANVRKAAEQALKWHDPSAEHPEHVEVRFGTGKLRQVRDHIIAQGKDAMSPKELPPGDWSKVRDRHGNVSVQKIDEYIESLPAVKFGASDGAWTGAQRHSKENSQVFQLNLSTDQVRKLKEAGVWETFRRMHELSSRSGHPIGHAGLGWVRWTGDEKGVHIDEVQSDLGQSFVKQMAARAREGGHDVDSVTAAAQLKYPEEHYQKIRDIVFGGKHPSEVLTESFLQYLRNGKKPDRTGYNRTTGSTFQYGGRKPMIGTPIHIWQPESKASISLAHGDDQPLPGHFMVGYRDVPQKRLGMKPAKYGELETQSSRKHQGKATWTDTLRKHEPGRYTSLGEVSA